MASPARPSLPGRSPHPRLTQLSYGGVTIADFSLHSLGRQVIRALFILGAIPDGAGIIWKQAPLTQAEVAENARSPCFPPYVR